MVIPASCKDIINSNRINECYEPDLEGKPLKQQVHYLMLTQQVRCNEFPDTLQEGQDLRLLWQT